MAERENIRSRLKKHQLTQVWLINQLGLRGIVTDKTEMSSVLAGTRSGSNYAVLKNIYHARRNHKLDEWHTFCHFIESLPHSELITE